MLSAKRLMLDQGIAAWLMTRLEILQNEFCDDCGAVHEGKDCCYAPHSSVCLCPRCKGEPFAIWAQNQIQLEEENPMIKVQRANAPQGQASPRGVQFLSLRHVPEAGLPFTIVKVTTDKPDNWLNPYVVHFENGGQKYSKGYSSTSDALATLVDLFGEDEKKWIGKTVIIGKQADEDLGVRLTYSKPKAAKA
jgi:hypothetical protein